LNKWLDIGLLEKSKYILGLTIFDTIRELNMKKSGSDLGLSLSGSGSGSSHNRVNSIMTWL